MAALEHARDELRVAVDVGADLQHGNAPIAARQRHESGFGIMFGCSTANHGTRFYASSFRIFSENGDVGVLMQDERVRRRVSS